MEIVLLVTIDFCINFDQYSAPSKVLDTEKNPVLTKTSLSEIDPQYKSDTIRENLLDHTLQKILK